MSLYTEAVNALELLDNGNSISNAVDAYINADNPADMAAAAGVIAAEISIGFLTATTVRTAFSAIRLGLAVSGKIDRWEALSKVIGIGVGLSAGEVIDWINSFHPGAVLYDVLHPGDIDPATNTNFNAAYGWRQPRYDPLTLDLDGDGLETVGINPGNPILFDHDGDGITTGTGWVKPDDGFLVLDRNGNGTIDSGRELFGDSTLLPGGGTAADGFAALVEEDTNADGRVDALDARFGELRIWRDLNQNGISEAGELSTLEAAGIVAIRTAKTEHSATLANGNQIADKGTFVRADGTEGALVEVTGDLADIDLADNPFYSEFTDAIALTVEAQALPAMQGAGAVQDLREAA